MGRRMIVVRFRASTLGLVWSMVVVVDWIIVPFDVDFCFMSAVKWLCVETAMLCWLEKAGGEFGLV
jgi:hypothetical protein